MTPSRLLVACTCLVLVQSSAQAGPPDRRAAPAPTASQLSLQSPLEATVSGAASIRGRTARVSTRSLVADLASPPLKGTYQEALRAAGRTRILVKLRTPSVRVTEADDGELDAQPVRAAVSAEQESFLTEVLARYPGAKVLARLRLVLNAVVLEVDEAQVGAVRAHSLVQGISRLHDYELDLSDSVPYVGGTVARLKGLTGRGVRIAILDSGIDYTHAALGGAGTTAAYAAEATDPTTVDGTFPTARVVGGRDFTGDTWPNAPEAQDPDPIDLEGHGTHVADIAAGRDGMAPGADLYAVKVCSSVSSSCSGLALLQGVEFAVDPDGDGDPEDHVDIMNLSLGSIYGQPFDDDLVLAVDNATALGVLSVASAGNSANRPYIVGTPAAARTALGVAQTAMPTDDVPVIQITAPSARTAFGAQFPWTPRPSGVIAGPVQYGNGSGGALLGCNVSGANPFPAGSLAGKIVLVDRGGCTFQEKVSNLEAAGARLALIGLVTPEAPFPGAGTAAGIPGFMISQADANLLRTGAGAVTVDPATFLPLAGSIVASSSRGPDALNRLKPEIGAPGASISAVAGSGAGTAPFGGTSGAAPMVSGAAALLKEARPRLRPAGLKALLISSAETGVLQQVPGPLAPVSLVGGGELRVDRAVNHPVFARAWTPTGTLSFGAVDVTQDDRTLARNVVLRNLGNTPVTYDATATFRYADDAATGAVIPTITPSTVTIPPRGRAVVRVSLEVIGANLPANRMNAGSGGNNPGLLTFNEFDGYVVFRAADHQVQMPWHILPRKAARTTVQRPRFDSAAGAFVAKVTNGGVGTSQLDAFSLLGTSPDIAEGAAGEQLPTPDLRAVGVRSFPSASCSAGAAAQLGIATHERQSHPFPVIVGALVDINGDGATDYEVFSGDTGVFSGTFSGQSVTWVFNAATGTAGARFFTGHAMNSGNTTLTFCLEQIGLTAADYGTRSIGLTAFAQDFYFGGPGDAIEGLSVVLGAEQYLATGADVPANSQGQLSVFDFGPPPAPATEQGILVFTDGSRGALSTGAATARTEALVVPASEFIRRR